MNWCVTINSTVEPNAHAFVYFNMTVDHYPNLDACYEACQSEFVAYKKRIIGIDAAIATRFLRSDCYCGTRFAQTRNPRTKGCKGEKVYGTPGAPSHPRFYHRVRRGEMVSKLLCIDSIALPIKHHFANLHARAQLQPTTLTNFWQAANPIMLERNHRETRIRLLSCKLGTGGVRHTRPETS